MKQDKTSIDIEGLCGNIKQIKRITGQSEQFIIARLCLDGLAYGPTFREAAESLGIRAANGNS